MVAQAQFSVTDAMVQPGETHTLSLTLTNIGNHTETYTLIPSGLLAGWIHLEPPTVTLFGGTGEDIHVTLRPPMLPSTPAGAAPLTIRVIPLDDPDEVVIAETTVTIGSFHERQIQLLQPVARSRRRAVFEFLVANSGNSQATCRLHLIETSHRLDGDFNPAAVSVEPGGTSLVRLRMKAIKRQWSRGTRTIPFTIEADQQGYPTAAANATFLQSPILPERMGRRIVALVLIAGALLGAWFGLIKPEARRAAEKAVRDQPGGEVVMTIASSVPETTAATVPPSTQPGDTTPATTAPPNTAPPTTTATAPSSPAAQEGTLFTQRLAVDVGLNATGEASIPVPAGQELRVTDLILQNLHGDEGLAVIYKNDQILFQFDLSEVFINNEPLSFATPLVFEAGSNLRFTVACGTTGEAGQCSDGLLVIGRLATV